MFRLFRVVSVRLHLLFYTTQSLIKSTANLKHNVVTTTAQV